MKICCSCQEAKDFSEFHKNRTTQDGYATECKLCRSTLRKQKFRRIRELGYPEINNTEIRICAKCGIEKSLNEEFHKSPEGPRGKCLICKDCRNTKNVSDYHNGDDNKKRKKAGQKNERIIRNLNYIIDIKNNNCVDCNKQYVHYCMEFDHIGKKTCNISRLVWDGASLEKINNELKQCELVCILCHRMRTFIRKNRPKFQSKGRSFLCDLKSNTPCANCNIQYHSCQMDIDHINPDDKLYSISKLAGLHCLDLLFEELKKCQVLCALCHRLKSKEDNFITLRKDKKLLFSIYGDTSFLKQHKK